MCRSMLSYRSTRSRDRLAFTLIELLLVMVILAILAAVVVPKFAGRTEQARESQALQVVTILKGAISSFEVDNGVYPQSLDALLHNPGNLTNWHGPYVDKLQDDPWGHPYIYHPPENGGSDFIVLSAGPDGQEGTADDIK